MNVRTELGPGKSLDDIFRWAAEQHPMPNVHVAAASYTLDKDMADVTDDERLSMKMAMFPVLYGRKV